MIDSANSPAAMHVAFLFRVQEGMDIELLRPDLEKKLPAFCFLPCGWEVRMNRGAKMPTQNVPCPCGDPGHWLVKLETIPKPQEAADGP